MGSFLNQRTAEFSLCNTLVLLLDLAFKQFSPKPQMHVVRIASQFGVGNCAESIT